MNFLPFEGVAAPGAASVRVGDAELAVPDLREGARGRLALGVRPEHIRLDDAAPYRGRVRGDRIPRHDPDRHARHRRTARVKARVASSRAGRGRRHHRPRLRRPHALGLRGRAAAARSRSAANEKVLRHG